MSLIHFVKEMPPYVWPMDKGWGNGYVALPKSHQFFGLDYDIINQHIDVHGGLTFSDEAIYGQPEQTKGMWIVGFDTSHWGDGKLFPDKESVLKETLRLKEQLEKFFF